MWWSASSGDQGLVEFVVLLSLNMAMLGFIGSNFSSIAMQPFGHIAGAASSAHTALRMGTGAILGGFLILVVLSRQNGIVGALSALVRLVKPGGRDA